jgi:arylsulfatase A-like enzyme
VLKPPRGGPSGIVSSPISHIDLFPTILDLLGLPNHPSFQGTSAIASSAQRRIYLHSNAFVGQDGVVLWPWKLLITFWPRKNVELYNLVLDPSEMDDRARREPEIVRGLIGDLARFRSLQIAYYAQAKNTEAYHPPRH